MSVAERAYVAKTSRNPTLDHEGSLLSQRNAGRSMARSLETPLSKETEAREESALALNPSIRNMMESKFGADFSRVRIHTDHAATTMARQLGAKAFTVGQDVSFAANCYEPHTPRGAYLLAHELAHTLQQKEVESVDRFDVPVLRRGNLEAEADECAALPWGVAPSVGILARPAIQLTPDPGDPTSGAAFGKQMAEEMRAAHFRGNPFREFQRRLNASPARLAPPEAAEAIRVGTQEFTRGTMGTMPPVQQGEVLVVPSRAPIPNAPVMGIHADGTVIMGKAPKIEMVQDAGGRPVFPPQSRVVGEITWEGAAVAPGGAAKVPSTGGAGGEALRVPDVKAAVTEPIVPEPLVDKVPGAIPTAQKPPVGGVAGEAPLTGAAASGVAGEVAGIVLGVAVELLIGLAIGLVLSWLKAWIEESLLKRDLQKLEPEVKSRLGRLEPKIVELQKHGKVYSLVTFDVMRRYGIARDPTGTATPAPYDFYEGVALVGVDVAGQDQGNSHNTYMTKSIMDQSIEHNVQACSSLLDDPEKRARQKEQAALMERMRRMAAKAGPTKPPATQTPQPQTPPPILAPPGPPPPPKIDLLPGAPGPSRVDEARNVVASARSRMTELLQRGENLIGGSPSPSNADIHAFGDAEEAWRVPATFLWNHYKDNGPDEARAAMDELLHADKEGGRLIFIRHTLGLP